MATSNDNLGYNTHILGTIQEIESCLCIILYNSETFKELGEPVNLSLYNLEDSYRKLTSRNFSSYIEVLRRSTAMDKFKYKNGLGFNTIIYISSIDEKPIGYTEFINTQGQGETVGISIDLESNLELGDVIVVNTLFPIDGNVIEDTKEGIENNEFPGSDLVRESIKDQRESGRYTRSIPDFQINYEHLDYLDSKVIYKGNQYSLGFSLNSDMNLYKLKFTNRNIGYYKGDLVIYSWFSGTKFCVTSLTKTNRFGNAIVYTKSGTGYYEIPSSTATIKYGAGRYMVCEENGKTRLYDFETKDWFDIGEINIIINPRDPKSEIIELPKLITSENLLAKIPDIQGTFLDIRKYTDAYTCKVLKRIGSWFVLRRRTGINTYLCTITGPGLILYTTEEEVDKIFFLNDSTLILKEDSYYILYSGLKEFWTEKAYALYYGKELETRKIRNIDFIAYKSDRDVEKIYSNRVAGNSENLEDTFLNNYRRNIYPVDILGLPEIVETFGGLIFYKSGYNIKYL